MFLPRFNTPPYTELFHTEFFSLLQETQHHHSRMRVLVVTVSDRCSKGESTDASGPKIVELVAAYAEATNRSLQIQSCLVPDELHRIQRIITQATDRSDPQFPTLIITTGGTGFAMRDVTPEAVRPLLDKEAPGLTHYMVHIGLKYTPYAWLSRSVAGVRKRTVIVTMPGNPNAIAEVLPSLLENGLMHAVSLASGEEATSVDRYHPVATTTTHVTYDSPRRSVSPRSVSETSPVRSVGRVDHSRSPDTRHRQSPPQHSVSSFGPGRVPAVGQAPLMANQLTPRRTHSEPGAAAATLASNSAKHGSPISWQQQHSPSTSSTPAPRPDIPSSTEKKTAVAWRERESLWPMVPMPDALSCIDDTVMSCGIRRTEQVPLHRALGTVLAESVHSAFNHPPFRASIKDGYAVVSSDGPGLYPVVGSLVAGAHPDGFTLRSKQICRVNTGGPVPHGADAVIQVEDTKIIDVTSEGEEQTVLIMSRAKAHQDIRPIGCDLEEGGCALDAGTTIRAPEVGLAASVGAVLLTVYRKPTVAVLSTGDELEEVNIATLRRRATAVTSSGANVCPSPGRIFDSNKSMLMAATVEAGYEVLDAGIARDNMDDTRRKLRQAWETADVVISTGGVSMGEVDCVKAVLTELGATIHFGRVNMKPGKPTTFASLGSKLFFALPGNPVSAMVCFHLFVVPALRAASGMAPDPTVVRARLVENFKLDKQRPEHHRCILGRQTISRHVGDAEGGAELIEQEEFTAKSTGIQASHRLLSMAGANGLVVLPAGEGCLATGTLVDVIVIGPL